MNALRLTQGFSKSLYVDHTGLPLAGIADTLKALQEEGLLKVGAVGVEPTLKGRRFLNEMLQRF